MREVCGPVGLSRKVYRNQNPADQHATFEPSEPNCQLTQLVLGTSKAANLTNTHPQSCNHKLPHQHDKQNRNTFEMLRSIDLFAPGTSLGLH
jgi:hypothetical protein